MLGVRTSVNQFRNESRTATNMEQIGDMSPREKSIDWVGRITFASMLLAFALVSAPLTAQEKAAAQAQRTDDYRLHAGDSITVSVWKELDLQRRVMIRPDGRFSFPLAGEVQAAGRTPDEVRAEIETQLKKLIPEAVVTVIVEDFAGNRIYVIGQVTRPGMFVMNPSLTVLQALSLAGGSTPFAKLDNISVIRGTGANQKVLPFRYGQVVEGKSLQQNIALESGDVVVVP
jgi:polysaccharide biosynthesis/export protein